MSILIKGMAMPKNCMTCPFVTEFALCTLTDKRWIKMKMAFENRHPNCPLIELPPHGRLIDADALLWNVDSWDDSFAILDAPTIIEREE